MNFGDIVGQLLQQGMSGQTQGRLTHALGDRGIGGQGGGLEQILGGLLGGGGQGGSSAGGLGGLAGMLGGGQQGGGGLGDMLGSLLGGKSSGGSGGMSNAQVGGIGAIAGALLGGGGGAVKGAIGGSAMALLGTLALSALKNWQHGQSGQGAAQAQPVQITEHEAQQMAAPQTAELCLKAMISAAKADGQIQDDEMQRIVGKLEEGGISEEERSFVVQEMSKPLDLQGLISEVPNTQVAAQVYAASLLAIKVDTQAEEQYLQKLANGLGLDAGTVQRLHQMVGA
ncbi:MAG: tellurite resistance TerB family protein [Geminicoccaceae bacterium]|nr:tellurite resistance TerB family protein [Geminicoccaceae bacterium]